MIRIGHSQSHTLKFIVPKALMNDFKFTMLPNEIWDLSLNIYQRAIIVHIIRKTIGWGKSFDGISLSQFVKDLGISKPKVISTLKELKKMNLIAIEHNFLANNSQTYNTYKLTDEVVNQINGVVNDINRGSKCGLQGVVNNINTQKKANTKETNTKDIKNTKKDFFNLVLAEFETQKIKTYSSKINKSKCDIKSISKDEYLDIAKSYAEYVKRNKNMSSRLDKWLVAYKEGNLNALEYTSSNKSNYSDTDEYFKWKNEMFGNVTDTEVVGGSYAIG